MQFSTIFAVLPLLASMAVAHPLHAKREVPQEHSHEQFLTTVRASIAINNPQKISDPVFGLLGNAAASQGQGSVTNTDCLQQATADQAFTNAKAAGDVAGQTAALIYRALERNTGGVGKASVICTDAAVNPEIAAISQHQDPASTGAAATNKAITLALAKQIAAVGGNPQDALKAGTFSPGNLSDNTAKGNTCDDANDAEGCIFTQNLLVEDSTAAEIDAAVAGIAPAAGAATESAASPAPSAVVAGCAAPAVTSDASSAVPSDTSSAIDATSTSVAPPAENNAAATAGIDVGACTDFSMTFAAGLAGRKATEFSFEPTDLTNFNHGTALNGQIITQFMCDTFVNACGKSASTRDACATAKAGIDAQKVAGTLKNNQDYADAWLSAVEGAFGIKSTGTGTGSGGAAPAVAALVPESGDATASSQVIASAVGTQASAPAATAAPVAPVSSSGDNVQTFTGTLNGVSPPPVIQDTSSNRPFSVNGDTFVNKAAAIQRSCDIQNNACSNAFNSGKGTSNVDACNAQQTECNAAA